MVWEHTLIVSPLAAEILRFNSVPEGFKDGWGLGIHPRIDSSVSVRMQPHVHKNLQEVHTKSGPAVRKSKKYEWMLQIVFRWDLGYEGVRVLFLMVILSVSLVRTLV